MRRGLAAGERVEESVLRLGEASVRGGERGCAAAPLAEGRESDCDWRWREKAGWGCGCAVAVSLKVGEARVLSVLCDQRLRLATPSLKTPKASPAPVAALLRRLAPGGVDKVWGLDGSRIGSLNEADRLTVTVDDDESELLREGRRRGGGAAATSVAAVVEKRFMAERARRACAWVDLDAPGSCRCRQTVSKRAFPDHARLCTLYSRMAACAGTRTVLQRCSGLEGGGRCCAARAVLPCKARLAAMSQRASGGTANARTWLAQGVQCARQRRRAWCP